MSIKLSNKEDIQNVLNKLRYSLSSFSLIENSGPSIKKLTAGFNELDLLMSVEDNAGIQDLFILMHENLIELQRDTDHLNQGQKYLFECWIKDIEKLLTGEASNKDVESLINLSTHYDWPLPLSKDDAVILSEMLDIDTDIHTSTEESNLLEMTLAIDKNTLKQETAVLPDSYKTISNNISELIKDIEYVLDNYSLSAFPSPDIHSVSEKLLLLADEFLNDDAPVLNDVCMLLAENLNDINEDNGYLNQSQQYLLTCFGRELTTYLSEPDDTCSLKQIIQLLAHYSWPNVISQDDINILLDMIPSEVVDEETGEKISSDESLQITSDTKNSNQIASLIKDIKLDLANYPLSAFPSPDIHSVSEKLLLLADEFLNGDAPVLNDVCMLLAENLNDINEDNGYLNQSQQYLLACFCRELTTYLSVPDDAGSLKQIIQLLAHYSWPNVISQDDINILLDMAKSAEDDDAVSDSVSTEHIETKQFDEDLATEDNVADKLKKLEAILEKHTNDTEKLIAYFQSLSEKFLEHEDFAILDVIGVIEENLTDMHEQSISLSTGHISMLSEWKDLMLDYIAIPKKENVQELLGILQNHKWLSPLSNEDALVMFDMFNVESNKDVPFPTPNDEIKTEKDERALSMLKQLSIAEAAVDELTSAKKIPVSSDLVEMLVLEMQQMKEELETTLSTLSQPEDFNNLAHPMSQYADRILRFGNACQAADMPGLYQVSSLMKQNLNKLLEGEQKFSDQQKKLLEEWPQRVLSYLSSLGDKDKSIDITHILLSDTWAEPLLSEVSPALIDLLSAPYIAADNEIKKSERIKTASAEDVSIELPEDINNELLEGLLIEMPGQVEELTDAIQSLSDGTGSIADMERAQRVVHTIKGAANTVGIKGIATLTHNFEDILVALCEYKQLPNVELIESMMDAADCLQEMYESLSEGGSVPNNTQKILQSILDWANLIEEKGAEVLNEASLKEASDEIVVEEKKEEQNVSTLRVSTHLIDEILRLLSESMIHNSQLQDRISNTEEYSNSLVEQNNAVDSLVNDLGQQVELRGIAFDQQIAVNSQTDVFDPLEFEQYNELNSVTNRLTESVSDAKVLSSDLQDNITDLNELLLNQTRTHRQLQELVMRSRMLPVKTLTPRLQRCVRQASRLTGKKVKLSLSGTDTLIDRDVADIILDPLMHILRNSIDHSIEDEVTRLENNKSDSGMVSINFNLEGANILIKCVDDGLGIDYDAIHTAAIEKGLLKPEQDISHKELNALLMQPGFTTKKDVTQVSGRGVGMDVVRAQIMSVKGTINIESEYGKGCTIELKIPASLLSNHGILVKQDQSLFAIANRGVEKIVHVAKENMHKKGDEDICIIDDEEYTIKDMQSLLGLPERIDNEVSDYTAGLIVKDEEIEELVVYDEFIQNMDFIIKNMGQYLKEIRGVRGGTILGNGDIAPVIDLPDLIRASHDKSTSFLQPSKPLKKIQLPIALVVDDSLSARRALANIANDAGYEVLSAQDGLDAAEIIDKKRPDILLLDMEMPRMNGLELTSHIRSNETTADIPIIMITSRTTDKHREQALSAGVNVYLSKPFQENELLDTMHKLLS